jgi:hypothetical protein
MTFLARYLLTVEYFGPAFACVEKVDLIVSKTNVSILSHESWSHW